MRFALGWALLGDAAGHAQARATKPIRHIAFGTGSRLRRGSQVSRRWRENSPAIVMSMPGCGEHDRIAAAGRATPDGYTLLLQS